MRGQFLSFGDALYYLAEGQRTSFHRCNLPDYPADHTNGVDGLMRIAEPIQELAKAVRENA